MNKKIIDISEHNGIMTKEKMIKIKNNCDGLIIRCGYGSDFNFQDDKQFHNNLKLANELNIPTQFYLFSYAQTTQQAKSEAQHVNRLLPENATIYFDIEDESLKYLDSKQAQEVILIFLQNLRKDIKRGIYCGYYNYTHKLSFIDKIFNNNMIWIADYSFNHSEINHQYTDKFKIDGLSCNFDMSNFIYFVGYKDNIEINNNFINENGIGTVLVDSLNVRNKPSINGEIVATYYKGEKINYDLIVICDDYVWLSYISFNGFRRYVACRVIKTNEKYIDYSK